MAVRAKFRCVVVADHDCRGNGILKEVILSPVTNNSQDNEQWSKYTPSGELKMSVTNPAAAEQFKTGNEYYIDISEVVEN